LLREINEETGIKISYFNKKFTFNGFNIKIKPIFLYESVFPTKSKTPTHQNFIIFYSINFPIYYKDINLKMQNKEIDAFVWADINDLYRIIYMNYKGQINGFKYDSISKKYKTTKFDYKNFKPNFINLKKEIVDSNEKSEYITHGHRTAIKLLIDA
jgi:8-oxo-dGTP pyrophosphatase MutT (NUDIX family)